MVDTGLAAFGILPKCNYSGEAAICVPEIIWGMIEIVQIIDRLDVSQNGAKPHLQRQGLCDGKRVCRGQTIQQTL